MGDERGASGQPGRQLRCACSVVAGPVHSCGCIAVTALFATLPCQIAHLLIYGSLPTEAQLKAYISKIAKFRGARCAAAAARLPSSVE